MSSSMETLLSNAQNFRDLEPNLNNLTESDSVYFKVEETYQQHPAAHSNKRRNQSLTSSPSNFVPTFWSDIFFTPNNKKHRITAALITIAERGVNDIEDFCNSLASYGWSNHCFDGLRNLFTILDPGRQERVLKLLQEVAKLALKAEKLFKSDILLLQTRNGRSSCSATFSREQCASLVANMFYCTFPECEYRHKDLNVIRFFARSNPVGKEKLKYMLAYFEQILQNPPTGCVSFVRKSMSAEEFPVWYRAKKLICKVAITSMLIEDLPNCLQVDFANKYIGGGVMNAGATQEEIRFLMSPEMFISLLLCPVIQPNEAIYIKGAARYSDFSGYGNQLRWEPYNQIEPRDKFGRVLSNVVAIDAEVYGRTRKNQYDKYWINRELKKAYVAFESKCSSDRPIATGNWGCGVFGGDKQLKALIQILAASMAGRDVIYSPFGEQEFAEKLQRLIMALAKNRVTVGQMYKIILEYRKDGRLDLFDYARKRVMERK